MVASAVAAYCVSRCNTARVGRYMDSRTSPAKAIKIKGKRMVASTTA